MRNESIDVNINTVLSFFKWKFFFVSLCHKKYTSSLQKFTFSKTKISIFYVTEHSWDYFKNISTYNFIKYLLCPLENQVYLKPVR